MFNGIYYSIKRQRSQIEAVAIQVKEIQVWVKVINEKHFLFYIASNEPQSGKIKEEDVKLFKPILWRAVTVVAVILSVILIAATPVANTYDDMINFALGIETSENVGGSGSPQYYTSDYDDLEEMYQAKVQLIREIAQEGAILLKNNGALPVESGKVTLFGKDNFIIQTVSPGGGSISGTMKCTDLETALRYEGLTVNTDSSSASGSSAAIVVIGRAQGEGADIASGSLALTADEKSLISSAKSASDKVIVLLSGDFSLEVAELESDADIDAIIRFGNAGYRGAYGLADVICGKVSPSGKIVETMAVNSRSAPAMQNFGNYSYTNGNRIMASQAKNYVVYAEGIYTDYKYYETRYEDAVLGNGNASSVKGSSGNTAWNYADEVIYPYGYGLSYTTFMQEIVGEPAFDNENHTATVSVKVTNTGDVAGKEVVQIYAQSPYTDYDKTNKVEKASVQLMGFGKTQTLKKGETETVEVKVNLQWLASYDYTGAKTYIMDEGDYYFSVGNGAHEALNNILAAKGKTLSDGMTAEGNAALTYKWHQEARDTITYAKSLYTGKDITNAFADVDINYWVDSKITYLSRSDWNATYPETVSVTASADMISSLNDTKKYENGTWNDTKSRAAQYAAKETNSDEEAIKSVVTLRDKDYNDENWDVILNEMSVEEMANMVANGRYYIQAVSSINFPRASGSDSPIGLNMPYVYLSIDKQTGEKTAIPEGYTMTDGITDDKNAVSEMTSTMYCSEPVLAATFNTELAARQGDMYGEDGLYSGTSFLWGLGVNQHRTPYGGRAAEYFSADSVHSTLLGAAMSKTSKEKGVVLVAKHFVINEQEQNRIGVATFTNEQALRENYLRAFEGIATYGEMQGLMGSYNRVGIIGANAKYDLMTTVLRNEWGSQCYVITDLGSPTAGLYDGNASIAAGTSTMMNNGSYGDASGSYVNTTLNVSAIQGDSVLLQATREACHRMLYNFIHSNVVNGFAADTVVNTITPWWKPTLIAVDIVFGVIAVGGAAMYLISCNIKKKEGE